MSSTKAHGSALRSVRTGLTTLAAAAVLSLTSVAVGAQEKGGSMTYLSSNIPSLNPLHSAFEVGLVSSQIFASLVRLDENNRPVPYLAESFSISDDGLAYTFNLAKNATFHDGKPVTSADVAFSLGLVKELHRFGPQMFGPVETVETPDDHTVIFRLSKRHGPLLVAATTPRQLPIMPKHVYGDGDFMKHPAHKNPVGSGPFVLKEFKTDQYYIVERNPNHFIEGLPHLDQIIYKLVKDKTARRIGLQRNEFQLADASGVMRLTDIAEFTKVEHLALTEMKSVSGSSIVLEFNNREGPLANKAVRQAIAYGIDRAYIANVLHAGYTKPSQGPLPFTNIFDNPDITGYPYDVDKANALLDEAGYPAGDDGIRFELGLIYIGQPFRPDLNSVPGEYIAQTLKNIGIKVNQEPMAGFAAWGKRIAAWNFDMSLNWPGDKVDPAVGVSRLYVCDNIKKQAYTNTSGYCNEKVDMIFAQAAEEADLDKRQVLYDQVSEILIEDMPMNWLFDVVGQWFHHKDMFLPSYGWGESWDLVYWKTPQG